MHDWIKVVTQPLGLAGFALFLMFGLLARKLRSSESRWFARVCAAMAFIALVGGLGISFHTVTANNASRISAPQVINQNPAANSHVVQQTLGNQSPAVAGVNGDVTVNNGTGPPAEQPPSGNAKNGHAENKK